MLAACLPLPSHKQHYFDLDCASFPCMVHLCNKMKFLGKIFFFLESWCVIFLIIIKLLLSTAVCLGKVLEHARISIGCNCVVTDATIPGP